MRYLRVYTPSGRQYTITDAGYGSIHIKPAAGENGGEYVDGGRGSPPLSEDQLTRLAEALAAALG